MSNLFRNDSPGAKTLEEARTDEIKRQRELRRKAAELAAQGRGEDTEIAHVARGEIVVPEALQTPEFLNAVRRVAKAHGISFDQLRIGSRRNSINPETGVAEFDPLLSSQGVPGSKLRSILLDTSKSYGAALSGSNLFDPKFRPALAQAPHQFMYSDVIDDPFKMPSHLDLAQASLPTDREAQKRSLQSSLFPNAPPSDVENRMFSRNGRAAYRADDGALYYAEPTFKPPTSINNIVEDSKFIANKAGPAIPLAMGLVGSRLGGARGAALMAGQGQAGRQFLADQITGESKPVSEHFREIGTSIIDEVTGNPVGKYLKHIGHIP